MLRVRILHIENGRLRFIRPDFFLALSRFKSVKSLTLRGCRLNNTAQLQRIVSAFPQLTDLTASVDFAQQSAASYVGASLSQPPSHMRLRYLKVFVDGIFITMFLDWMTRSGLCTSLADLTFRFCDPSTRQSLLLNKLLETAGASLTRYCERVYGDSCHGSLMQNTVLRSLDFRMRIVHTAKDQGLRAAWTRTTYTPSSPPSEAATSRTWSSA